MHSFCTTLPGSISSRCCDNVQSCKRVVQADNCTEYLSIKCPNSRKRYTPPASAIRWVFHRNSTHRRSARIHLPNMEATCNFIRTEEALNRGPPSTQPPRAVFRTPSHEPAKPHTGTRPGAPELPGPVNTKGNTHAAARRFRTQTLKGRPEVRSPMSSHRRCEAQAPFTFRVVTNTLTSTSTVRSASGNAPWPSAETQHRCDTSSCREAQ
jgi:hypothetical protein